MSLLKIGKTQYEIVKLKKVFLVSTELLGVFLGRPNLFEDFPSGQASYLPSEQNSVLFR
jgi:hypothetical protein